MKSFYRRFTLLATAAVAWTALVALGQVGDIPLPNGNGEAHIIRGQVLNSVTGQPIARALVQVGGVHSMLTDHEGHFEFDVTGEAGAFASKPGYFPMENSVSAGGDPVALRLIPEATLSGTVNDQSGQPIQDLQVTLKMLQVRNGLLRWDQAEATRTNAEGEFRFAELRAGKYRVATGFHLDGLPDAASSIAYVPVVYPPLAGDPEGGALTLSPGEHAQADVNPPVEKLYRVSGILQGMVGQGAGFEITTQDGEMINPSLHVYPGGAFWCRLPSGAYHFKVNSFQPPPQQQQVTGTRDVQVGRAALEGVLISLVPQPVIPVEVDYQFIAASARQDRSNGGNFLNLSLEQSASAGPLRAFNAEPMPPNDGSEPARTMVIRNVEPGRYELRAQTNGEWYLASATCGNLDLLRDPIVISPEAGVCTIRAVLRNDTASLKWSSAAGDPGKENSAGNAANTDRPPAVIAIPLNNLTQSVETANNYQLTNSGVTGSFERIAPGRYLIIMLSHSQELPYREPAALDRYRSLGQEVTLTRSGQAEVQLHEIAGEP